MTRRLGNAGGLGIDSETEARDGDLLCVVELAEKQPVTVAGLSELSKLARVRQGKRTVRTCPCATAQRAPPPGRSGPPVAPSLRLCLCMCARVSAEQPDSPMFANANMHWRIPARHIRFEACGAQLPPCEAARSWRAAGGGPLFLHEFRSLSSTSRFTCQIDKAFIMVCTTYYRRRL